MQFAHPCSCCMILLFCAGGLLSPPSRAKGCRRFRWWWSNGPLGRALQHWQVGEQRGRERAALTEGGWKREGPEDPDGLEYSLGFRQLEGQFCPCKRYEWVYIVLQGEEGWNPNSSLLHVIASSSFVLSFSLFRLLERSTGVQRLWPRTTMFYFFVSSNWTKFHLLDQDPEPEES